MVRIPGIPREAERVGSTITSGSLWSSVWWVLVTVVLLAVAGYVALTFSVIGGIIAFAVVTVVVGDRIARAVSDTYDRRWARVPLDPREWF